MATGNSPISEISRFVRGRGYESCSYAGADRRSGFYRKAAGPGFECFVYFRYLPAHEGYDVTLGVQSIQVREYLGRALWTIFGEDFSRKFVDRHQRPCLSMFNADALVKWPRGEMPAAQDGVLELALTQLFHDALEPVFESVNDFASLLDLMLRDDPPFEWWRSSISPRLVQIVVLATATNSDWSIVRDRIKPAEDLLVNDSLAGSRAKFFVPELRQYCVEHQLSVAV